MAKRSPALILALLATTACVPVHDDEDDTRDPPGPTGSWELDVDTGCDDHEDCDDGGADEGDGGNEDEDGGSEQDGGGSDGGQDDGGATAPDPDKWCNAYMPFEVGEGATLTYDTWFFDGESHTETVQVAAWSAGTGRATVRRSLDDETVFEESWRCDDGVLSMSGYTATGGGYSAAILFSQEVQRLLPHDDLVQGARWSIAYTSEVSGYGPVWSFEAEFEVLGPDVRRTDAGSFDVMVVEATYQLTALTSYSQSRAGTVTYEFAPGLGLVYSRDRSGSTLNEERSLSAWSGDFSPFDPDAI